MSAEHLTGVTRLLDRWCDGERGALDELITVVYEQLTRKAHRLLCSEGAGNMLQTSALVHEAYLRLMNLETIRWQGRQHFFVVAAGVMRRILVDQARARNAYKRGGGAQPVTLHEDRLAARDDHADADILALDKALEKLAMVDNLQARVVELRYFAGISVEETAATLGISPASVKRKWTMAKSRLYRELRPAMA